MHVRFSSCKGVPVVEEGTGEEVGRISDILIHPDSGKVEGFFIHVPALFASQELFLSTLDILRFGTAVSVRSHDILAPAEDHLRLAPLLEERRPVLGQRMRTEGGKRLGRCADVQLDTSHWHIEWLFPRRFLSWGTPLPLTEIVEVRHDAIVVRDTAISQEISTASRLKPLQETSAMAEPAVAQRTRGSESSGSQQRAFP